MRMVEDLRGVVTTYDVKKHSIARLTSGGLTCSLMRAALVALLVGLGACSSVEYPDNQVPPLPPSMVEPTLYTDAAQPPYHIGIGDVLFVQSYFDRTLRQTVTVRPDGFISLILLGDVFATGKTTRELDAELTQQYDSRIPAHPDVTVTVDQMAGMVVYVGGEVKYQTLVPIKGTLTLLESVTAVGGFLPTSNQNQVLLLRQVGGGHFRAYQIDASLSRRNQADEVYLHSHDVVYVPKTKIALVDQYVDQYINQIVPRFINSNFGYQFFEQVGQPTVSVPGH